MFFPRDTSRLLGLPRGPWLCRFWMLIQRSGLCLLFPPPVSRENKTFQWSPHHELPQKEGGLGPWLRIASIFSSETTSEASQDFCLTYVRLIRPSRTAKLIRWSAAPGHCPTGQGSCPCCHLKNVTHPLTCLCWYKKGPVPCALVVFRASDSRTVMTFLKSPSGFHEVGRVEAVGSAGLTM